MGQIPRNLTFVDKQILRLAPPVVASQVVWALFQRHVPSEINEDSTKLLINEIDNRYAHATKEGLRNNINIDALIAHAKRHPGKKYLIICSGFLRAEETAMETKRRFKLELPGRIIWGPHSWKEIGEYEAGTEVRFDEKDVKRTFVPAKEMEDMPDGAGFWLNWMREGKPVKNSDRPIGGESLNDLYARAARVAVIIKECVRTGDFRRFGVPEIDKDIVPIFDSHCWFLGALFREFGLFKTNRWGDLPELKNGLMIEVKFKVDENMQAVADLTNALQAKVPGKL